MASVNKVILVGNLGKDPEVKYGQSGDAIATFSIATTEKWKDKNGDKQEKTEWHRVVFFGRTAEVCGEYLKKGSPCYVEGRLQTRKYEKDGRDVYTTEVVGQTLQLLGDRSGGRSSGNDSEPERRPAASKPSATRKPEQSDIDDDIPF